MKKSNRLLANFILTISNSDFTSKLDTEYSDTPYRDLNIAFNKIINQYQNISKEKEMQHFFIDHLIQTIPAGILIFNKENKISFKNKLGETLLNVNNINTFQQIESRIPLFYSRLNDIDNVGSFVFEIASSNEKKKLSVKVKSFNLFNENQKLITIQDVSKEVDAGELDAIQRLMRILTHEIMNSLTPINSLTETITMLMHDENGNPKTIENLDSKSFSDIRESIIAIKERGEGLDHFVNKFRTLTKLPETMKTESILVKDLFNSVCKVMDSELSKINVNIELEKLELELNADIVLVEQVIINLITNSLTAMLNMNMPKLILKSFIEDRKVLIQVIDNGQGIPKERLSDVFMPFYSTKEKGSGIGLSFVRQIMRLHNGSINVKSELNKETMFSLKFNL